MKNIDVILALIFFALCACAGALLSIALNLSQLLEILGS